MDFSSINSFIIIFGLLFMIYCTSISRDKEENIMYIPSNISYSQ